jgi:predicted nucleotidyltransferase
MEDKLKEFVQRMRGAAPDNLKAIVLYGSAATGEFHEGHSNVNLLCLVESGDPARLEPFHSTVEWWTGKGHSAPLIFTLEELRRSADIFAIELLDMQARHKMLFGEEFLAGISVPLRYHKLQVERELRSNWLRLRQTFLAAPRKAHLSVMVAALSPFTALFRHALIALGAQAAENKREAVERVAKLTGAGAEGFLAVLDFREKKKKESDIDVTATARSYFALVEAVTDEVDRRLEVLS